MQTPALIIANPKSAGGAVERRWPHLQATIHGELGAVRHAFTRAPEHARELAAQAAADGYRTILALGGDGTINEVANGLLTAAANAEQRPALAVLPFGTGGDYRRSIAVPPRLAEAARLVQEHPARPVDVGRVDFLASGTSRYFVNIASFGLSGATDELVAASSKRLGGKITFALKTLQAMRQYEPLQVRLSLDGAAPFERPVQNFAIAVGRCFGGGMQIAPNALLDDGQFDVVDVAPLSMGRLLRTSPRLYRGTHLDLPEVTIAQAQTVEAALVDPSQRMPVDVDGELPGCLPARFQLVPRALRVHLPPGAAVCS